MKFVKILEESVSAAKKANDHKSEISQVIIELTNSIEEFTNKKVTLIIDELIKSGLQKTIFFLSDIKPDKEMALVLMELDNSDNKIVISKWKESDEGYPVIISYDNKDIYCMNKEELEQALSYLIGSIKVGTILFNSINK